MHRPEFPEYFLRVAKTIALRADCTRRQVGCVIVGEDQRILGHGYNGSHPGGPSCLKGECPRGQMSYEQLAEHTSYDNCIATHAETNAIIWAGKEVKGATLYCTDEPCPTCWKTIRAAQIGRVVTPELEVIL